jgi:hypothetical protein
MASETQCKRALEIFEGDLTKRRNVVGLGIVPAEQYGERRSGRRDCAVGVYVTKKLPANRLSAKDLVPEVLRLRGKKGDVEVPTRVIESGEIRLEIG